MNYNEITKQVQKELYDAKPPKTVKVVSRNTNGTYNLTASDGTNYNNVRSQTRDKWAENHWVTIEFAGGDWAITGLGVVKSGD